MISWTRRPGVVFDVSKYLWYRRKSIKRYQLRLHSLDKHLSSISNLETYLLRKMKVQFVLLTLDDHGQLTRLYSSLHSVASLLLRSSVSQLLPRPMGLTQIPRTPARPIQRPSSPRLTHPMAYELIPHVCDLSSNGIIGLCRVHVQNGQRHGRTVLR